MSVVGARCAWWSRAAPTCLLRRCRCSVPAPAAHTGTTAIPAVRLSGRQQQVFDLLLKGMPNKVIGSRLSMAEGTVKAHLNTIYRVLGVRTRVEAILRARQLGMA